MTVFRRTILTLALFSFLCLSACATQGEFGPIRPTLAAMGTVANEPEAIDFATLNNDPHAYINHLLRVRGNFRLLNSNVNGCIPFKGPKTTWALEADGFRMNMSEFDRMVNLAPDGASVTVDGVWHLYQGPVGCGKEPAAGEVWHLEVNRIVDPNPLVFAPGSGGLDTDSGGVSITEIMTVTTESSDVEAPSPTPVSPEATPTLATSYGEVDISITETAVSIGLTTTAESAENGEEEATATPTPTTDGEEGEQSEESTEATQTSIPTRSGGATTDTPTPSVTPTLEPGVTPTADGTTEGNGLGSDGTGSITQTIIAPTITPTPEPYTDGGYASP